MREAVHNNLFNRNFCIQSKANRNGILVYDMPSGWVQTLIRFDPKKDGGAVELNLCLMQTGVVDNGLHDVRFAQNCYLDFAQTTFDLIQSETSNYAMQSGGNVIRNCNTTTSMVQTITREMTSEESTSIEKRFEITARGFARVMGLSDLKRLLDVSGELQLSAQYLNHFEYSLYEKRYEESITEITVPANTITTIVEVTHNRRESGILIIPAVNSGDTENVFFTIELPVSSEIFERHIERQDVDCNNLQINIENS